MQRDIVTPEAADRFLNPTLDRLHDPFLLPDALPACERIKQALAQNEKILVHGDYDGDGVTSAALWTRVLRSLGADVDVFVPHRQRDGYDMRIPFIEDAKSKGVKLIITTDCGIQRVDEVEHARHAGIDVIITDHHTPNTNGELPRAVAVVNPHRKDSLYPFPTIAGVGVAFKMGEALTRHLGHNPDRYRKAFLDLAAIGTITDVMPLMDENRIIVKHGLEALQNTKKPGLRALIDVCGYREKTLDAYTVSHGMGPRLNAASRVDETRVALDVLLTKDDAEGQRLAHKLNEYNIQRKDEQARIFEEAMEQVVRQDMAEAKCLVLSSANWTGGIVGLVASKMTERFHRPCIVISLNEATGMGRGSARSIHAFNIFKAIDACRDLLAEYGGHEYAAGLSIAHDNVPDFSAQMNRIAGSLLQDEDLLPTLDVAAEIDSWRGLSSVAASDSDTGPIRQRQPGTALRQPERADCGGEPHGRGKAAPEPDPARRRREPVRQRALSLVLKRRTRGRSGRGHVTRCVLQATIQLLERTHEYSIHDRGHLSPGVVRRSAI